jgi:hypothetical protein
MARLTSAAVLIIELQRWLEARKLTSGLAIYTQWDWKLLEPVYGRGVGIGVNAPVTITAEGNALMYALALGDDAKLVAEFSKFIEERGYFWEGGYSWTAHLYPIEQPPRLR